MNYFVGYEDINKPTKATLLYQILDIKRTYRVQCPCEDELGTKICSNLRPLKQYQLCVSKFDNGPTITTIGIKVIHTIFYGI